MPAIRCPPAQIKSTKLYAPGGISYIVFAALALAHALVAQWMWTTIGEPYRAAVEQNERIQAASALQDGIERRNLLQLQTGLTRAAEIASFNETLFDDAKLLHRTLRKHLDALTEAVAQTEVNPIAAALRGAIELHSDQRPIVDRHNLRTSAKKLQELNKQRTITGGASGGADSTEEIDKLLGRVRSAIDLSREIEENADAEDEEDEVKLPGKYLPSFWACLAFFGCLLALVLTHMSTYWSVGFKAIMYYHPTSVLEVGSYVHVVPLKHRGAAELVPLQRSSSGTLFFMHQRQKFEVTPLQAADGGSSRDVGQCQALLCPTDRPLREYAASSGFGSAADLAAAKEQFGENSFAIPMPTWLDLYKEQLASPIAVFQLLCSVLWMLDEYWKYTMFTLFMILTFEGTTAFSRLKNLQQLRGMSAKPVSVYVYRSRAWVSVMTNELLPRDIVSLKRTPGAEAPTVPADCVVLRGGAVVNESTLTGESVPQLKDALTVDKATATAAYDMKSNHRVHTLYSGTLLMQSSPNAASADSSSGTDAAADGSGAVAMTNCDGVPAPPDGGCVCYVLATAFSSSQGELMRMIEFSTAKVSADKVETLGLLLLLLVFALAAAGYVLQQGLIEGKKTQYELVLKCVLILTSVVPPELPMQTALAVNTALMALMKAQVFCTEPFRVPYAGKLTHALFDKTGTLTTDELTMRGVVTATTSSGGEKNTSAGTVAKPVQPIQSASAELCSVIGGCHALLQVDGKLMGDPIELAAVQAIGWSFDASRSVASAHDPLPKLDARIKSAEAALSTAKKNASRAVGSTTVAGGAAPPAAADVKRAQQALDDAKKARERGIQRRDSALCKRMSVRIVHRHHFSSALGRMSVIAQVKGLDGSGDGERGMCLVKGSPEAVGPLLATSGDGAKPPWFEATYTGLAEQGLRVLALACKPAPCGASTTELAAYAKQPRERIESELRFCGFLAFGCPVRKDSASVIRSLRESRHTTIMLTGDAPLTALHVANDVGMTGPIEKPGATTVPPLILSCSAADDDATPSLLSFEWIPALAADKAKGGDRMPFSVDGVRKLRAAGHDLLITGKTLASVAAACPDFWRVAELVTVYARMSPEGKERVVREMGQRGLHTLMCGDGGNDVGALKAADVGVSLLTGFGNANADKESADAAKGGSDGSGEITKSGEEELAELTKAQGAKQAEMGKKYAEELNVKRAEMAAKQKDLLQAEVQRRVAAGEGAFSAQFSAMKSVTLQLKHELQAEQALLAKKYGGGLAGQASFLSEAMFDADDEQGLAPPMVKLGDASIAAPFTSKLPSIRSCVDIIRQGHCTLVSTVQQQQYADSDSYSILMLHCLISAYSLSALSLDGSRASEPQLIASGMLLSCATIAFSFARPLDKLSPILPLSSIFHPALLLSVLGQLAVHAGCMFFSLRIAKQAMSEGELREAILLQKKAEKLEESGEADTPSLFSSNHKPNLLNTIVFLVETAQQVAVMLVNYKGRPWMKGATENPGLLYSLAACVAGIVVAAWEIVPQLNDLLGLVALPTEEMRYELLAVLGATLIGSFVWDRLCLAIFAPSIFASQLREFAALRASDFWGPNSPKYVGGAILGTWWLVYTEGNMIYAIGAYYAYRKFFKPPDPAAAGGAAPPAVD